MKGSECESSRLSVRCLASISPPHRILGKPRPHGGSSSRSEYAVHANQIAEALVMSFVDTYYHVNPFMVLLLLWFCHRHGLNI